MKLNEVRRFIEGNRNYNRSAWGRGLTEYANELIDTLEEYDEDELANASLVRKAMLNGAVNWSDYSWSGCSLIYNGDIAARLATPSELKRTRGGALKPNAHEEWLDTQARALGQAAARVIEAMRHCGRF